MDYWPKGWPTKFRQYDFLQDLVNQDPASTSSIFEMLFISKSLKTNCRPRGKHFKRSCFYGNKRDVRRKEFKNQTEENP